ncbi:LysM peptidoglycan-binding domain-containing protein [Arthrobacter sp. B1805]|uniref:LysM peptidoglycan-binding domain-containing protein n=1 Tax=Arthrobacter sp. B1805 TaxID=2058892 RepID=UPI0011B0048C|nr:hypothetical protein [Arthrobacter sp. B1805]
MKSSDALQAGLVLACGIVLTVTGHVLRHTQTSGGMRGLDHLLGVILSIVGVVITVLWLLALAAALVAECLQQGGRLTAARFTGGWTPAVMRRLAAALLGVNMLAVPAMANAAPQTPGAGAASAAVTSSTVSHAAPRAFHESVAVQPGGTAGTTAGTRASPYWSPRLVAAGSAEGQVSPTSHHVSPDEAPDVSADVSPDVSPAWEPSPMPPDGGLLVRPETRKTVDVREVVVGPGDSLWSIAAQHLGPLATAADVAEAWPAWYQANRSTIGKDASLLVPGQLLRAPTH